MNNKGFTLVELVTTFALVAVIVVLLINVLSLLKEVYEKSDTKTQLYVEQANFVNSVNSEFNNNTLLSYYGCLDYDFCYVFEFDNNETKKLYVDSNVINFGNKKYKINSTCSIDNPSLTEETITVSSEDVNDSIINIKIPVECEGYTDLDFGINIVYQFNSNLINFD